MQSIHEPGPAALDGTPIEPTSVYRYYDRHGILIYVGITKQGIGRNRQHERNAEWWRFVARQEVEHYLTRLAAARRERELIFANRPPFNKQHNGSHEELRAAYLGLVNVPPPAESPAQQFNRLGRRLPLNVLRQDDDELILVSRMEHEPLASIFALTHKAPICVWGTGKRCGRVMRAEVVGALVYLVCEPHGAMPAIVTEGLAGLKFHTKPLQAQLLRVHVVDAAGPVVG